MPSGRCVRGVEALHLWGRCPAAFCPTSPVAKATRPCLARFGETDERCAAQLPVGCVVRCSGPTALLPYLMSILSIVALGFAMSADAFAAALAKGACMPRPRLRQALTVGITFGVVEAMTPLVGWMLGSAASQYITAYDHWVAFVLLMGLGLHMVWKSFQPAELDCEKEAGDQAGGGAAEEATGGARAWVADPVVHSMARTVAHEPMAVSAGHVGHAGHAGGVVASAHKPRKRSGMLSTVMTSVATSIDAMAVGVTLAFVDVPIGQVALVIGLCTTLMVTLGVMLGRLLGTLVGQRAELLGGVVLMVIGSVILYEHLTEGAVLALLRGGALG